MTTEEDILKKEIRIKRWLAISAIVILIILGRDVPEYLIQAAGNVVTELTLPRSVEE